MYVLGKILSDFFFPAHFRNHLNTRIGSFRVRNDIVTHAMPNQQIVKKQEEEVKKTGTRPANNFSER